MSQAASSEVNASSNGSRQTLLLGLALEDLEAVNGEAKKKPVKNRTKSLSRDEIAMLLRVELAHLNERLSGIEEVVSEVQRTMAYPAIAKEFYSISEAAKILRRRPYTVREWCRLGRVKGQKAHSGRGLDEEWRISHEELTRIQNEGLLPQGDSSRLPPPPRLPK
jgi:hypothetical protein